MNAVYVAVCSYSAFDIGRECVTRWERKLKNIRKYNHVITGRTRTKIYFNIHSITKFSLYIVKLVY